MATASLDILPDEALLHILLHAQWVDCIAFAEASPRIKTLWDSSSGYAMRCQKLERDGVYISKFLHQDHTPKQTFEAAWPLRRRWHAIRGDGEDNEDDVVIDNNVDNDDLNPDSASLEAGNTAKFRIRVAARFRPLLHHQQGDDASNVTAGSGAEDDENQPAHDERVIVPLHQRLRLIRKHLNCDRATAQRTLWGAQHDPWSNAFVPNPEDTDTTTASQPAAREPLAERQSPSEPKDAAVSTDNKTGMKSSVVPPTNNVTTSADRALDAEPGDEHSRLPTKIRTGVLAVRPEHRDLLICAMGAGLRRFRFDTVFDDKSTQDALYTQVGAPVVSEFLNGISGTVFAFGQTGSVGAWHGVAARAVLEDQLSVPVHNAQDMQQQLLAAERNKRRAATAMNQRSSRAHTLTYLTLVQRFNNRRVRSLLCLADLGGSEQLKKSRATGQQLQEAVQINMGLLALKECIDALKRRRSHIPYMSSRLTSLLQPALMGNSTVTVVITGSLEQRHTSETLNALRFGDVCSRIEGDELEVESDFADDALEALDTEIKHLEERIRTEERWVNKTVVRQDADGEEVFVTSVLEGAEELRERYEQLLATRHDLIGV
ncbi:uncharacterized protein MONBRDRAFT_38064 [Monosiga brevicollis MX1]|uniref:Kinesin motor domain-containing protein n=1 Tax=Monosiga brevicollis TaxID=81824 RepID=A9V5H1_MONBE|nr:uncharacterized protein MONBRDRAFT_38064 [Monosiga brevicollis MX1]EDQ87282.1 predicted protein [Monosiga brevicollis MX1]|eukprot:XP_001747895.1 hypothetical protein [Monosiga brevicollis MX1]